jgi:arginyl-tRNA--protein-N-Asp/Glu arginylyltransferase
MDSYYYITAGEKGFRADTLDRLLAAGYYRMQHLMFTCNETALTEDGQVIPVFWLRTLVQQCRLKKAANTILKKSQQFSVSFQPAYIDDEVEALYALYKNHVPFSVSTTCADYLHQDFLPEPFDSMMVQVRDKDQLIAAGYFDKGQQSIAGIMNIYHPQYYRYSLGKVLMLQKLQYALSQNKLFYYTGYISTGSTRFDYKTFPDPAAVEVLLPDKQEWTPYHLLSKAFLSEYYLQMLP